MKQYRFKTIIKINNAYTNVEQKTWLSGDGFIVVRLVVKELRFS